MKHPGGYIMIGMSSLHDDTIGVGGATIGIIQIAVGGTVDWAKTLPPS